MLPVVYDPVVAQAIERYSHEYRRPDGVYLSIDDTDGVETALHNWGLGPDDVDSNNLLRESISGDYPL